MKSGTFFEILLPFDIGNCLGRFIDVYEYNNNRKFDSYLLLVYNLFKKGEITLEDINNINSNDLLCNPLLLVSKPQSKNGIKIRQIIWKPVGDEFTMPFFKSVNKFPYIVDDESLIGPWYLVKLGYWEQEIEYSKIAHLEQATLESADQVYTRIVLEYCRNYKLDNNEFVNFDASEDYIQRVFLKVKNLPIYNSIPIPYRGNPFP